MWLKYFVCWHYLYYLIAGIVFVYTLPLHDCRRLHGAQKRNVISEIIVFSTCSNSVYYFFFGCYQNFTMFVPIAIRRKYLNKNMAYFFATKHNFCVITVNGLLAFLSFLGYLKYYAFCIL